MASIAEAKTRIRPQRRRELVRRDHARGVDGEHRDREALVAQHVHRGQHRAMFGRHGHDVRAAAAPPCRARASQDRQAIGFGTAAREDDLARGRAQEPRDRARGRRRVPRARRGLPRAANSD